MLAAVSPTDVYQIMKVQLFLALRGNSFAAKEVLGRCVGKAAQLSELIDLERADNSQIDPGLPESKM